MAIQLDILKKQCGEVLEKYEGVVKDVYGSTLKIIEEMEMRMVVEWWQEAGRDGLQMEESRKVKRDTKRVKEAKQLLSKHIQNANLDESGHNSSKILFNGQIKDH